MKPYSPPLSTAANPSEKPRVELNCGEITSIIGNALNDQKQRFLIGRAVELTGVKRQCETISEKAVRRVRRDTISMLRRDRTNNILQ